MSHAGNSRRGSSWRSSLTFSTWPRRSPASFTGLRTSMPDTQQNTAQDIQQVADEINDRVHALAFDAKGANAEVERLRRAIERIYWHIPATNGGPLDPCLVAILQEVENVKTWRMAHGRDA